MAWIRLRGRAEHSWWGEGGGRTREEGEEDRDGCMGVVGSRLNKTHICVVNGQGTAQRLNNPVESSLRDACSRPTLDS